MNFFENMKNRKRKLALRQYLYRVRDLLGGKYGKQEYYTPDQVVTVAQDDDLVLDDIVYVLAIYSTQEDYEAYKESSGETRGYWQVRSDIAHLFFKDNTSYTRQDITNLITPIKGEVFDDTLERVSDK